MDKNIGKKLDGRYEITELLGVGGMAEVYKGIDVIDNKTVAIKILKKEYAENEEFLRRFRNESKAIAVLSHPNIVKIYDVGFSEKIQYIVMEYIDGITLKEYIEGEGVLTWKDTVHFVIQILRALQHAHDKGIVHRDIKPQNIMMFTDGTIKVMDFGIAKFAREDGKTATDQAIGSVHYISPEQASGSVTDAKSDIYSVGAMMYEMLTGKKPFDDDNPVAIAVKHMQEQPERPRSVNPDIPDGIEEIVLKAMEKKPEDRYQTTGEMISDIEEFKSDPTMHFGYYQEEDDTIEDTRNFIAPVAGMNGGDAVQNDVQADAANGMGQPNPAYVQQPAAAAVYAGGQQPRFPQPPPPMRQGAYPSGFYEDEEDDDEDEERSSLVVPVLTAIVVVVIIVAVIFVAMLLKNLIAGGGDDKNDYRMPDFYNWDYNEAVSQYGNSIKFEIERYDYNDLEENHIIEQDIAPETEFKKGDVLKVVVSKGMETVEVPKVSGRNLEIAKEQLTQRGLEYEIKQVSDPDIKKGYVVESDPKEGTVVHKGEKILLKVSLGASKGQIKVDKYIGMDIQEASMMASYAGLKVVTKDKASYQKENTVVEQSIEPGEKVEEGTEITLYYSNGQNPEGEIPFTIPFPSDASGRFVIDFLIRNEDGKMTTDSTPTLVLPEMGSEITQQVNGSGEKVYVTVTLTNISNGARAVIGTYYFNFAAGNVVSETEDIWGAFNKVGAFEQPTEEPTEEPTEYIEPTEEPTEYVEPPTEYVEPPTEYVEPPTENAEPSTEYTDPPVVDPNTGEVTW